MKVCIVGGGLVGSTLALQLAKQGHTVDVYDIRKDSRGVSVAAGVSINLALSARGRSSLRAVSPELEDAVVARTIPMSGRIIHGATVTDPTAGGNHEHQPYSVFGDSILSVGRQALNETLITWAEEHFAGKVTHHFRQACTGVDLEKGRAFFAAPHADGSFGRPGWPGAAEPTEVVDADLIIGCDGAHSVVRSAMMRSGQFSYEQEYIDHSYKELAIAPLEGKEGMDRFAIEHNGLHIWPRGDRGMMIALPNEDGSFTVTLFATTEDFEVLDTEEKVEEYMTDRYPDLMVAIPDAAKQWFQNPRGSLKFVRCSEWNRGVGVIMGDAAHALVPFYGQGMNCGLEDAETFARMFADVSSAAEIPAMLAAFSKERHANGEAIQELSRENYIEMRENVSSTMWRIKSKLHDVLYRAFPDSWIPRYSRVTFTTTPYKTVTPAVERQDQLLTWALLTPVALGLAAAAGVAAMRMSRK